MLDRPFSTLLFDLDGTLIEYDEAQRYAASVALEAMEAGTDPDLMARVMVLVEGEDVQDIESCRPGWEPAGSARMSRVFQKAGVNLPPEEFLGRYFEAMGEHGVALDGVEEMLSIVSPGRRLAVVSNGLGPIQRRRLQMAGLMQFFDAIVLSCEVGSAKPDPAILRLAMRLTDSEPEETLFIGDSVTSDMGAAKSAGVPFVYIDPRGLFPAEGPRILELRSTRELTMHLPGPPQVDPDRKSS